MMMHFGRYDMNLNCYHRHCVFSQVILSIGSRSLWDLLTMKSDSSDESLELCFKPIEVQERIEEPFPSVKRVRFLSTDSVILVPERKEYVNAGIATAVWWSRSEHQDFVKEAREELHEYMEENTVDRKSATRLMYQPTEQEVKPVGSPTSVVPNYEEYKQLIEAYATTRETNCTPEDSEMAYYFSSIAATECDAKMTADDDKTSSSSFIPVKGRERSCSTVEREGAGGGGRGLLGADDSWTVLRQAPGCAGLL